MAATIAIVVLSIIWLYRVVSNHRAIGRDTRWGPGWAIGGWFVPPIVVYAVPMLVLRESWQAADPAVPPGDDRWRRNPVNPLVYVWWVLYGLVPIIFLVAGGHVLGQRLRPGRRRPRRRVCATARASRSPRASSASCRPWRGGCWCGPSPPATAR